MRVALITTGKMEMKALGPALARLFPGHEFSAPSLNGTGEPHRAFTPKPVGRLTPGDPPGRAAHLLEAALDWTTPEDAHTVAADVAFVVEDLELANQHNEDAVVGHVQDSAERIMARAVTSARSNIKRRLRERVSFHLAVPMPESWFFGDPAGPRNAGVRADRLPPRLTTGRDPEAFLTDDPEFDTDQGAACATWVDRGAKPEEAPPWIYWGERRREHPKAYLAWLMRHPGPQDCHDYRETKQGARALKRLDWSSVLANAQHYPYLRALVRDLEFALQVRAIGVPDGGRVAPLTAFKPEGGAALLRNL